MNRKLLCDALSMIDEAYIEEIIIRRSTGESTSSERKLEMERTPYSAKHTKRLISIAIAACLVLSMVITAAAANLWGLRELFSTTGQELPEQAEEYIQPQSASAQDEEWSCRITESLCDRSSLTVAVDVTASEKYVIAPTDASPSDSARGAIGVDSDLTLSEYAAAQSKELLFVNASLMGNDTFDVIAGMLRYEYVTDSHAVLMAHADIESESPVTHGICTVHLTDDSGKKTEQILEFDLTEAPVSDSAVFIPVDPGAVDGLRVGKAAVTVTPVGVTITMEQTVLDETAFGRMEFVCEQFPGSMGGSVMDANGEWLLELNGGQGEITDTLTISVRDCATCQPIGDIVFTRQ